MRNNKIGIALLMLACGVMFSTSTFARPDVNPAKKSGNKRGLLKTTASCKPAESSIDLDINNVRARLMTGGDMWWDNGTSEARYEVPKGSRKNALFAGSVWIGGYDEQKQLKVAAQTYRQSGNDYWPGPLDPNTAEISEADCSEWDRFWKVDAATVTKFRALADKGAADGDPEYEVIMQWPARGNGAADGGNAIGRNQNPLNLYSDLDYAPFVDLNNNNKYEPLEGEYPDINGDQYIWWVFNDKGNVKNQSNTEGIGIEVQASAFAYSTKDFINDATFYNYRLINRGSLSLDSTYISTWTDADLGYYRDDYIGCDTSRDLGILYNGVSVDGTGQVNSYGEKVPMVGIDFFKGPIKRDTAGGQVVETELGMTAFTYYNNDNSVVGNPSNGIQIYNYMSGSIRNGQRFSNDFKGPNTPSRAYGEGPTVPFVFTGDPGKKAEWSECTCNNPVGDRRFVHSSGPFRLEPGVVNDITIGAVWVADVGGCPNTSFTKIQIADDLAQALFDSDFEIKEGPQAPRMVVREMNRKLVCYLINDSTSNNYQERYGYDTAKKYRVASIKAAQLSSDSLYKFEGYRVFQLRDRFVTPADIFGDDGEVDNELAIEVFQCDIKNGITTIVNYERKPEVGDSIFVPAVKVSGADSGIKHSFELTIDQFAKTEEKRLVNYKSYYYVAIAYGYNNFAPFEFNRPDSTQDQVYIESSKAGGGGAIEVVTATPNPANGEMGTVLNSDYGDGITIKRLEGTGNGGISISMDEESEMEALLGVDDLSTPGRKIHQSLQPTYKKNESPVDVKVIDPVKLKAADYELYLSGPIDAIEARGLRTDSSFWRLVNVTTGDVIYGERSIGVDNEQILETQGISVRVTQTRRPNDSNQHSGNGYITSDITFADPGNPWLAGVQDQENASYLNWIRSGNVSDTNSRCNWDDKRLDTVDQVYEKMLPNYSTTVGTWAPYGLASDENSPKCGFGVASDLSADGISSIPSVDVVLTSDRSKWTRCLVLEMQDEPTLVGGVGKMEIKSHRSWNGEVDDAGRPVYSTIESDTGYSWFPGYAVNQETGERLNIMFGEDSWLREHNGDDMIWNPTSTPFYVSGNGGTVGTVNVIFGGKHTIYIDNQRYDSGRAFINKLLDPSPIISRGRFRTVAYVGVPLLNALSGSELKPISEGIIPNETRIRIRVTRPYTEYNTGINGYTLKNGGLPLYEFSTKGLAPTPLDENPNADKQALLDRIHAVPNPYYGYTGYELTRYDTRVKIINLPTRATVSIYSLDGSLVRRLEKDDPNVSYIDWDIRNSKSLPIASGMYLIHVNAEGIGETVLRWFGAMRPIDITNY